MMGTTPPWLRPPWLRIVLVVAIVWLGVALVHGVNFTLKRVSGEPVKVSDPRR